MDSDLEVSPRAIRNARMRRGLSVNEVAKRAGMAPRTLYEVEAGTVAARMRTIRKIAEALEVEVADLLVAVPAATAGEGAA